MRRLLALLVIVVVLAPTWLREPLPRPDSSERVYFHRLPVPPRREAMRRLGWFDLEAAWEMTSPDWRFGGYSALLAMGGGEMLAVGDRGELLHFGQPGTPPRRPRIGPIRPLADADRYGNDAESATYDPASKQVWIGWENGNRISRHGLDFGESQMVQPPAMRGWSINTGPEAMVRLTDGRFIVLREGFDRWLQRERHAGVLFAGDPITARPPIRFTFVGPRGFSPTDMAQLPDGRVLILMRRLLWPLPPRFEGRIVLADPREITAGGDWRMQVVAKLSSPLEVDNFEGLAIEPRRGGKVTVWLISDANNAVTQRTLLWKLAVDPAKLRFSKHGYPKPDGASKKARGSSARPSANQ